MRTKGNIQDIYPLTPMQEGMLYHALADPTSSAYFEQMSYRMQAELDIEKVKESLNQLVKRYDILRTAFIHEGMERPMQVVLKERECGFMYQDLRHLQAAEKKENAIMEFKQTDRARSFNLAADVLIRVAVLQTDRTEYEFTWSNHHILMDGWCTGILVTEFLEIYNSFLENRPWELPEVPPYRVYIQWLEKQDKKASKQYWEKYLEAYETSAAFPRIKSPNILEESYQVGVVKITLDNERTRQLNHFTARYHVTLNTIVQALWAILLGKYCGKQDVVFGAVVSGRPSEIEGVESMVGLFVNTVPVRITYETDTKFNQLLKKVQQDAVASEPYHYYPLAEIQSAAPLKQDLLDHLLVFENYPVAERIDGAVRKSRDNYGKKNAALNVSKFESFEQTNYDLDLVVQKGTHRLFFKFNFNNNVYNTDYIQRMSIHFENLLNQVSDDDEITPARLTLLSEAEKEQLLKDFNNTREDFPADKPIHRLIEEQVQKTPNRPAVFYEGQRLTYRQTNEQANQLARMIRARGMQPEQMVGMLLERSVDMAVGMLAVLKAGGALLPLEPEAPDARNRYMMEENQVRFLLTQRHLYHQKAELMHDFSADTLVLMDDKNLFPGGKGTDNLDIVNPNGGLALVLYTSGTTGKPKGILLEHRNVNNYIHGLNRRIFSRYEPPLNIGLQAPYTFDGFPQMVLGAMWYGHCAYIVPDDIRADGGALLKYYKKHHIHITDGSPAHLRLMVESLDGERENLELDIKNLLIAGDVLPCQTVKDFLDTFKNNPPIVTNSYGPTECCGDSTFYHVTKENINRHQTLPIGTPMPNEQIYIVDKHMKLQPIGVWGEICIGGEGVGRGYLKQDTLTKEKFIPNPFLKGTRLYRTGDLARWLPDGNIEFSGRIDQQVKIRGYRIEPEEVKNQLLNHEDIRAAVVTAKEYNDGDNYLCAYYVARNSLEAGQLRHYLAKQLPSYMIPAYFVPMENIPHTPRGKVDLKALPDPRSAARTHTIVPPSNESEEKIRHIWAEILGLDPQKISIHDDYYELGGNSINIINVLNRMKKEFQHPISLSSLILYPTIKELAANIYEQGILNKLECVVKLNKGGNEKNIFIIHPMNGQVYIYKDLAKLLENHYNIYGIQARGIVRRSRPAQSLPMMVEDYISQVRIIQPEGPYIIMGHCIGDVIAYLMVKRLEKMKCPVERLIMSDESNFAMEPVLDHYRRKERLKSLFKPFIAAWNLFKKKDVQKPPYADYDAAYKGEPEITPEESEQMKNKVHFKIQKLNREYFSQNPFRIIDGIIKTPILDIKAKDSDEVIEEKVVKKMTFGPFKLAESDGEHFTLFQKPHVYRLAEVLKNMNKN
jgi:amino acid adenylation domain-containing protein